MITAITGSHHHPSFQPTAEILHGERGEGDLTPSLQLHQVGGKQIQVVAEMMNGTSSTFQFPQRHGQPLVEHQSRVPRKLHRLLRRGLCLLSQATKPILDFVV